MKLLAVIPMVALGFYLAGIAPAFAEPLRNLDAAWQNAPSILLASRDPERELRGNGRDRTQERDRGERRQQYETRRGEPAGRFGYGFERRQEQGERAMDRRNGHGD